MTDNEKYFRGIVKGFGIWGSLTVLGAIALIMDYIYPGEALKMFRDFFALIV